MSSFEAAAIGGGGAAADPTEEEVERNQSLTSPEVVTKYQEAAKIANSVLLEVIAKCTAGAVVIEICKFGDVSIVEKLSKVYNKKDKEGKPIEKTSAFPVCVSVNEVVCHFSPMQQDAETAAPLKAGDMVKIDLGVHIDGYIAVVAHTVIVAQEDGSPVTGLRAAALQAAYTAAQATVRLIRPGNTNVMVQEAIKKISETYNVRPVIGSLMHQMKRYIIDGNKRIYLREEESTATTKAAKQELATFEANEVYAVDVAVSSGDGKPKDRDIRTSVYKRVPDAKYGLKSPSARAFYGELCRKFEYFPFSLRQFDDERTARVGITECRNHGLVEPYPVVSEKEGDEVAHFKFTVLVLPSGTSRITGLELPANVENAAFDSLPQEIKDILALEEGNKKKKKKAAAAKAATGDTPAAAATADTPK